MKLASAIHTAVENVIAADRMRSRHPENRLAADALLDAHIYLASLVALACEDRPDTCTTNPTKN
jgi:hypothetical protein